MKVWDVATGKELFSLSGHGAPVSGVVFSPDGTHLASASWDGTLKEWSVELPLSVRILNSYDVLTGAVHSARMGRVWLWLSTTEESRCSLSPRPLDYTVGRHAGPVTGVAFSPDGRCLTSVGGDKMARIVGSAVQDTVKSLLHDGEINAVAFAPERTSSRPCSIPETRRGSGGTVRRKACHRHCRRRRHDMGCSRGGCSLRPWCSLRPRRQDLRPRCGVQPRRESSGFCWWDGRGEGAFGDDLGSRNQPEAASQGPGGFRGADSGHLRGGIQPRREAIGYRWRRRDGKDLGCQDRERRVDSAWSRRQFAQLAFSRMEGAWPSPPLTGRSLSGMPILIERGFHCQGLRAPDGHRVLPGPRQCLVAVRGEWEGIRVHFGAQALAAAAKKLITSEAFPPPQCEFYSSGSPVRVAVPSRP